MTESLILPLLFLAGSVLTCSTSATTQETRPKFKTSSQLRKEIEQRAIERISGIIRGRCIDASTGKPLAACKVKASGWDVRDVPEKLRHPEPVISGPDGRFAIRLLAREHYNPFLTITHAGCCPSTGHCEPMLPGKVVEVGDIKLHKGAHAVGKVVNTRGEPMSGVSIWIDVISPDGGIAVEKAVKEKRPRTDIGSRFSHIASTMRCGTTGADGTFLSRNVLPPGTYRIRIKTLGHRQLEKNQRVSIPRTGSMESVNIVVKELPFISGTVVDKKGRPIHGVSLGEVATQLGLGSYAVAVTVTDKNGTFKLYREEGSPDKVAIRANVPRAPRPTVEYPWGTTGVKIVLPRQLSVAIEVVETKSGKPIEDFAIRCFTTMGGSMLLRQSGHHVGGRLTVAQVDRGLGRLIVVPKDMQLLPTTTFIDFKEDMKPVRVQVARLVPMKLIVLDTKGKPAAQILVQVITPGNQKTKVINNQRSQSLNNFSSGHNATFDTEIYRATTDAAGQCIVYGLDRREDLILELSRRRGTESQRIKDVEFGRRTLSRRIELEDLYTPKRK